MFNPMQTGIQSLGQSAVPPELADLIATAQRLESVAQMQTPQGGLTVAGNMTAQAQQMAAPQPPQMPQAPQMPGMTMQPSQNPEAQNAGVGAAIQGQQMQEAQQALMKQAMAARQGQQMGGVAGLQAQVGNFAEGGIVGYSGERDSVAKDPDKKPPLYDLRRDPLLRKLGFFSDAPALAPTSAPTDTGDETARLAERAPIGPVAVSAVNNDPRNVLGKLLGATNIPEKERLEAIKQLMEQYYYPSSSADAPSAAPSAPPASPSTPSAPAKPNIAPSMEMFREGLADNERAAAQPITEAQQLEQAKKHDAAMRQWMQGQGIDPDYLRKESEAVQARTDEQANYYRQRADAATKRDKERGLWGALANMRGAARLGQLGRNFAQASNASEAQAQAESNKMTEARFELQNAAAKERRLLDKARYEIAMGQMDKARQTLQEIETNRQNRAIAASKAKTEFAEKLLQAETKQQEIAMRGDKESPPKPELEGINALTAYLVSQGVDPVTARAQATIQYRAAGAGVTSQSRSMSDAKEALKSFVLLRFEDWKEMVKRAGSEEAAEKLFLERYMSGAVSPPMQSLPPKSAQPPAPAAPAAAPRVQNW